MRKKVIIRVDGNKNIGLGHLIRCIALAQMLKDKFEITFASKDIPEEYIDQLNVLGFFLMHLDSEDFFLDQLDPAFIVVLDGYNFGIEYQKRIKKIGCRLVCIDDLHEDVFAADLLINHAPGVKPQDYRMVVNADFALGLDYALLRPIFLKQATISRKIREIKTVLICFGGADYLDLTLKTLQIIAKLPQFEKIIVITGASYVYGDSLASFIENNDRIYRYHAASEMQMLELMLESDIAIVPTSGVFLEALTTGCHIVSGTYADNQKVFFKRFLEQGLLFNANDFSETPLLQAIQQALNSNVVTKKLIDGMSGARLLDKFNDLTLSIREVNSNDCELLFNWVNDSEVRSNALSSQPIQWEDHILWVHKKINVAETRFFILEKDSIPVGQIRYDKEGNDFVITYSIDKNYRGKGFGKKIIMKTINDFIGSRLIAFVKNDNEGSKKIFNSLGFSQTDVNKLDNGLFVKFEIYMNNRV